MTLLDTNVETLPDMDGRQLRVARLGEDGERPPVILLHGYPETLQAWHGVAPILARDRQVIAIDWPGMGGSDAWPGGATPRHKAKQIITLLDHWGIARAALVGMDMGGQPVLVCASQFPDRVERVAVMNSLLFGELETSWEIHILRKYGWNRWILRNLPRLVLRRCERTFLPPGTTLLPELRQDFRQHFMRAEVRAYIAKMCAGYQGKLPQLPQDYADVRCPCLILWGEQEKHFPPAHAERLHQLLPQSELQIIPGHHWLPLHQPEVVGDRLARFLSS